MWLFLGLLLEKSLSKCKWARKQGRFLLHLPESPEAKKAKLIPTKESLQLEEILVWNVNSFEYVLTSIKVRGIH